MQPAVGDIVTVTGQPGRWVVSGPSTDLPPGRRWRCISRRPDGRETARVVGDGDMTLVQAAPVFEPARRLRHWAEEVEVLDDLGDRVRVAVPARRKPAGTSPITGAPVYLGIPASASDVSKPALVLDNLSTLLQE